MCKDVTIKDLGRFLDKMCPCYMEPVHIVMCQAHLVLLKKANQMCSSILLTFFYLDGYLFAFVIGRIAGQNVQRLQIFAIFFHSRKTRLVLHNETGGHFM